MSNWFGGSGHGCQTFYFDGIDRRANGIGCPLKKELGGGSADSALARAHAAAGVQLCRAPTGVRLKTGVGHVFAAADHGAGLGELLELRPELKGPVHGAGEALRLLASAEKTTCVFCAASGGQTCDLPFD